MLNTHLSDLPSLDSRLFYVIFLSCFCVSKVFGILTIISSGTSNHEKVEDIYTKCASLKRGAVAPESLPGFRNWVPKIVIS